MKIGIVGLGLIGGSLAKAYKTNEDCTVYGADKDSLAVQLALLTESIDAKLTDELIPACDYIFLAIYPHAAVAWLEANAAKLDSHTVVIDCCGIKQAVCKVGFELAEQYGFHYLGGHPMAGSHNSGFKYAREDLFDGAPMVIVPPTFDDIDLLDKVKQLLAPVGFGSITVTTAQKHDEMIAFTSQMPHIVSNAYIKSPTAGSHKGFSAGSYKDLTRVAWLNPDMWTELFLENGDMLLHEMDVLIASLTEYRDAIANRDAATLRRILDEGRLRKKEIDGR